ncbi:hypothetical protein J4Q44_G00184300 [Coregonus suidteri]|uniref:Uncharacterized protein n=1 Tax=Coregonus suidteri TaxID=861788 RepID=A0AAN8LQK3_9TELE
MDLRDGSSCRDPDHQSRLVFLIELGAVLSSQSLQAARRMQQVVTLMQHCPLSQLFMSFYTLFFKTFILSYYNEFQPYWLLTPVNVGRGRGVLGLPIPFPTGSPYVYGDINGSEIAGEVPLVSGDNAASHGHHAVNSPRPQAVITSTPNPNDDAVLIGQMSTIVQQIGQQLADSIIMHFSSSSPTGATATSQSEPRHRPDPPVSQVLDFSQVQVVAQRKVKEPPSCRGERSDTITFDEWEEAMRNFIKKGHMKIEEQAEEILIHLKGREKYVVKIGIRNSDIDILANPYAIYSLLRKHFSCSQYSYIPLQDFYTTLPKEQEDRYEYWLRLNRAEALLQKA